MKKEGGELLEGLADTAFQKGRKRAKKRSAAVLAKRGSSLQGEGCG